MESLNKFANECICLRLIWSQGAWSKGQLLEGPPLKGGRRGRETFKNYCFKGNNKYIGDECNPDEPSRFIQYLVANNLYGYGMSVRLRTGEFKWMTYEELQNWRSFPDIKPKGCILDTDIEYTKDLYKRHNEYSLAPKRIVGNKVDKLIPNLGDKEK